MEGRGGTEGTAGRQSTVRTLSRDAVTQALARVREAAKRNRRERFTSLMHHMTPALMAWAFHQLKPKAVPGLDGVTWEEYGFRPGRSQHDALDALAYGINLREVNWVLDADIRSFFDCISHEWMTRFLEHRIGDRRVVRLIAKWLKTGVMEEGAWTEGTPQGAVISSLLANVYLHYVYDLWVDQWRKRRATGEVIVIRHADDTIVGFERHADAERFLRDLRERLATFGLDLHPDKTSLI